MRYAIGLALIGTGGLLIYGGFTNQSVWGMVSSALTGQPYERKVSTGIFGGTTGLPPGSYQPPVTHAPAGTPPQPGVTDPLGDGYDIA